MEISVIIPTHRPEEYLWECLDSLRAQTLPMDKFEVLVVLNGCKDPYYGQLVDYATRHADSLDIKFIHTYKSGVSSARNIGLDNAEGRFVAFIDDDDRVSPTYLEELYSKADEQTVVISNSFNYSEDAPETMIPTRPTELHSILAPEGRTGLTESRRFFFTVWMKLIPASIIADRRFDTSFSIGEDSLFMFKISDRIRYTDFTSSEAVYCHRLRSDSAMGSQKQNGRWKRIRNDLRMIAAYTRIYFSGLRRYSLHFYLTRVRGAIHV